MKPIDLNDAKIKKAGGMTIKDTIDDLLEGYKNGEIKSIVYVVRDNNDELIVVCNHMDQTEAVGMLECGKQSIVMDMYDY